MKCNNTHCKYYEPAEKSDKWELRFWGFLLKDKEAGCKYSYCKKAKVKRGKQ